MLENMSCLEQVIPCVLHHHERFDGTGYPNSLAGEMIPLCARIIAVANAFDAITNDTPYREKLDYTSALQEIERNSGTQFDPQVVKVFNVLVTSGGLE